VRSSAHSTAEIGRALERVAVDAGQQIAGLEIEAGEPAAAAQQPHQPPALEGAVGALGGDLERRQQIGGPGVEHRGQDRAADRGGAHRRRGRVDRRRGVDRHARIDLRAGARIVLVERRLRVDLGAAGRGDHGDQHGDEHGDEGHAAAHA
jgi:hypothetical protein